MELKKYWRTLVKRRVLFFSIFGPIIFSSLLFGFLSTPIYKATSNVLIKNSDRATIVSSLLAGAGNIN